MSAQPRWEASAAWFPTRAIEVVQQALGEGGLRVCEACMAPRAIVEEGRLAYQTGPVGLDEVVRLDDQIRGDSEPARTAIWLDENATGVSIRMVDLRSGRVIYAQNVDPSLREITQTQRLYTRAEELERRARGEGLTQAFVDAALFPGQHLSLDWTDQWGPTNANLTGLTLTVLDPVVGIGASHYRALPVLNALVGGKVVVSLPTALASAISGEATQVLDPLVTGVAVVRVPFGRGNYGAVLTASTNGAIGVGVSLMNVSVLPVLP